MVGVAVGTALASVGAGLAQRGFLAAGVRRHRGLAAVAGCCALAPAAPSRGGRPHACCPAAAGRARSPAALLVLLLAFAEGVVLLGSADPAAAGGGVRRPPPRLAGRVTGTYGLAVLALGRGRAACRATGPTSRADRPRRARRGRRPACVGRCPSQPAVAVVVAVLLGLAWAAMHSSLQTWATEVLPDARATVVSLFAGSLFVGSALASAVVAGPADADRSLRSSPRSPASACSLALPGTGGAGGPPHD